MEYTETMKLEITQDKSLKEVISEQTRKMERHEKKQEHIQWLLIVSVIVQILTPFVKDYDLFSFVVIVILAMMLVSYYHI